MEAASVLNSTGRSAKLEGPISKRLDQYFDTTQFVDPPAFRFGYIGRTLPDVRGPGLINFDMSATKNTRIREQVRLPFRFEGFNLWNTPAFDIPGTSFCAGTFGRVRAVAHRANPARQFMLAMKLLC